MGPTLTRLAMALLLLAVVFGLAERVWPATLGQRVLRRGWQVDLVYWFFTPLITRSLTRTAVILGLVVFAVTGGVPLDRGALQQFFASPRPLAVQPPWLQMIEIFLLGDLLTYWTHRTFHGRRLWRFHAIHHSSTQVDWLSAVRLHPVNDVVTRLVQVLPLFLLGFDLRVLAGYAPFISLYAILLHANVPWTFGPLRFLLASPTFHRWHHTTQAEGLNTNFAGLFPFIDICFGTFSMPAGRLPQEFGIVGEAVPESLLGQLVYPLRGVSGYSEELVLRDSLSKLTHPS